VGERDIPFHELKNIRFYDRQDAGDAAADHAG
jgi:hypothetical protein